MLYVKTDPRGATATFTYNARHLVTNITYAKPAGIGMVGDPSPNAIPRSDPVNFDYDAAGNRLWMTDGQGRTDYVYDTWSRLTSETRRFNDIPGSSWPLSYTYNLADELKTLTDAFGQTATYTPIVH